MKASSKSGGLTRPRSNLHLREAAASPVAVWSWSDKYL